ncbi:serine/threonine-protein phosphatase PGAM5, mitochondrial-like isoform X2 [Paramacrobiotus metropolitanus]|uniref:serine/threonine-protein phosphatase PGAM5, mitochondrial-like isoform X2 n=1 Tax=Paramacrobiotus metropolitanus TaxID=2943436 RepID=UPI00244563CE|nr:serine/threonine-protein phosphatase PGAM5, mitochondrial-like isoform X2 [Paramacrobiotus metropolitanus]
MPVGAGKKALLASLGLLASTGTAAAIASIWKNDDVVAQCAQPVEVANASTNFVHLYPGPPPGAIPCDGPGPSSCGRWDQNWDRREPANLIRPKAKPDAREPDLAAATPKATRNLFFIRHGHYVVDGISDECRMLTELGRAQAQNTGKRLRDLNFPWTKLIHSSMCRARETAQIIASSLPGVELESTDLIREGAPIPPEPPVASWRPGAQYFEDGARIEAAFRRFIHRADPDQEKDSYEIIVCHANVIRYFVCRALQLPPEAWLRMSLHHSSITWLTIRPNGRVSLRTFGDSGHIPPNQLTTS